MVHSPLFKAEITPFNLDKGRTVVYKSYGSCDKEQGVPDAVASRPIRAGPSPPFLDLTIPMDFYFFPDEVVLNKSSQLKGVGSE